MRIRTMGAVVLCAAAAALLAGCGGDDDEATPENGGTTTAATVAAGDPADGDSASGGSGSGTLTLDGESIALTSVRCFLEPQDSAGGGGQILFTGQGTGANGAGDDVLIDVSRYDEASMFAGDSVSMTVGDPTSPDSTTYDVSGEQDAIVVDGSTLSGDAITLDDPEGGGTGPTVSFQLNC